MIRKRFTLALALLMLVLCDWSIGGVGPATSSAQGTVYYVAPDGKDSDAGTEAQPWQTIQRAANTLVAGDTVYIKAGTYNERVVPLNSGSAGHYILYAAYPGNVVTLDGNGVSVPYDGALFDVSGKSYIRISGLQIYSSTQAGILADGSSHIVIERNHTYDTGSSGIGVWNSDNVIIDGNEVEFACSNGMQEFISVAGTHTFEVRHNHVHNGTAVYRKEGIVVKDGSHDGKVYGNYVDGTQAVGIYVDAWDKHTFNIEVFQNVVHDVSANGFSVGSESGGLLENVRIYNNVAYHNKWLGIEIHDCCSDLSTLHPVKGITITSNTFYNNGWETWGGGIAVDNPDAQNLVIRNNISSQNLYFQIAVDPRVLPSSFTIDHNLIDGYRGTEGETRGSDYVEGDPRFANPPGADFHLQSDSPAIDKGSCVGAPGDDFDGNARPQGAGCDIGADEYVVYTEFIYLPAILKSFSSQFGLACESR